MPGSFCHSVFSTNPRVRAVPVDDVTESVVLHAHYIEWDSETIGYCRASSARSVKSSTTQSAKFAEFAGREYSPPDAQRRLLARMIDVVGLRH